ncbi:MAG: YkvA family protein [Candidatus Limnocylindria bacterium]
MLNPGRWRYLRTAKVLLQLPTYARLVWGLARDARTPVGLKALLIAALGYVVMPIDLIPDVVPILGAADDLTVLLLVLDLFISNAPDSVREEHMARAATGQATLDADLARVRSLLGDRYDRIRDSLPELLGRFGGLQDSKELKRQLAEWRTARAKTPVEVE